MSHLVHLSIGSIANHLHQLKDSCGVLGRERRTRCHHFNKYCDARGEEAVNQDMSVREGYHLGDCGESRWLDAFSLDGQG